MKFWCSKKAKKVKGSISILLSIVLVTMFSFGSLVMESGRFQSAKVQLEEANASAGLSMLSNYNKTLQSRYGILAMDPSKITEENYQDYLVFNSDLDSEYGGDNLSILYKSLDSEIQPLYNLSNPNILKRQIVENAKYNVPINVAADVLDIDKKLEELRKNIINAIPGLEKVLDVCESLTKIKEALEKLYDLEVNIANLNRCEGTGNPFSVGLSTINQFVTNKEPNNYSPSYREAYDKLKKEVDDKQKYMQKNPEPQKPSDIAPVSSDTITANQEKMKDASKKLDLKILYELVNMYMGTKVFDGDKEVEINAMTKKCLSIKGKNKANEKNIKNVIKDLASSQLNLNIRKWDYDAAMEIMKKINTVNNSSVDELYNDYIVSKNINDSAVAENQEWKKQKKAYEDYNNKISSYNEAITKAAENYKNRCEDLNSLLGKYKENVTSAKSELGNASKAIEDIGKSLDQSEEDSKNTIEVLDELTEILENLQINRVNEIQSFLSREIEYTDSLISDANQVNSSYRLKVTKLPVNQYYMGHVEATSFFAAIGGISVVNNHEATVGKLFKNVGNLAKTFNVIPITYNLRCNVTLSNSTWNLLPSRNEIVYSEHNSDDISEINEMLNEARTLLGTMYRTDISMVEPSGRNTESNIVDEINSRIDSSIEALQKIVEVSIGPNSVLIVGASLVSTAFKLYNIVTSVITLVDNIIYMATHFQQSIEVITQTLYENVLLNSYIVEKFPNRVDVTNGKYKGTNLTFIPEIGDTSAFSAACVEYIINGGKSEKENQSKTFWTIFMLRAINNVVCLISDPEAMEIISACNIFAIIVFPLWVYCESNIDMNCLILLEEEVPLIKQKLILSIDGMGRLAEHLKYIEEDDAKGRFEGEAGQDYLANRLKNSREEFTTVEGMFKMKYKEYLWLFLFFKSNKTKVLRAGDLMQMDIRYDEVYNKKGTAKFLMKEANTFVRVKCSATFNSILPIISMSRNNINEYGIKVRSTKYLGY